MAKCEKCGKEIADGAVCSCQKLDAKAGVKPAEATKEGKKGKGGMVLGAVVPLVIIAIVLVVVLTSKPYMKCIDNYVALINEKCTDYRELQYTLMADSRVKLAKKYAEAMMAQDSYEDSLEMREESLEAFYDMCEDEFEEWTLTYELKDKEKLDKDVLEKIQKSYEDYYEDNIEDQIEEWTDLLEDDDDLEDYADDNDISEKEAEAIGKARIAYYKDYADVKVTDGYEVKMKLIVKGEEDEYKSNTFKARIIKLNGDWVYIGVTGDSVNFDEQELMFIASYLNTNYARY